MDYMTLDARCRQLFQRMDKRLIGLPTMKELACCQSWEGHKDCSFAIVGQIVHEMVEDEQVEAEYLHCFQKLKTPRTDLAKKVVERYLKLLAEQSDQKMQSLNGMALDF